MHRTATPSSPSSTAPNDARIALSFQSLEPVNLHELPGVQNAMSSTCAAATCASVTSVESMVQAATSLPKLCIVDLDKTVWDSFSASTTEPPYVRVCAPSTTAAG